MPQPAAQDELVEIADRLRARFKSPVEYPEPAPRLGLEARAGQPLRQFKHLHQMCLGHAQHFEFSAALKLLALLDGYRMCADAGHVLGHYLFARPILELCAFTNEVSRRLHEVAAKPEANWLAKGEEFFALIVRIRFASSDKENQKALEAAGFPAKLLKPVNIMSCISALSSTEALLSLAPVYEKLCDYVHHNGPSNFTVSSGFHVGKAATNFGSGSVMLTNKPTPITRYEYPTPTKTAKALDDTTAGVLVASKAIVLLLADLPRSPYAPAQIMKMTGTDHGLVYHGPAMPKPTSH